jgi:hypothetical protein
MGGDVAVVIVNWNGKEYLEPCLRAVLAQTYHKMEVVVVDNGSTDGSAELVVERFPGVRVLANDRNVGFAVANNQAIESTGTEFVALLNNDAIPDPEWLANLVTAMEEDPEVGSCASKILLADRPDVIDSTGIEINTVGIAWGRGGGWPETTASLNAAEYVFGASGGAALYRRTMLSEIGLFDPDFFAYLEDADLAWRARLAGWLCLYVPSARVYHVHSATAGRDSAFKARLLGRNKLWMTVKNYPMPELLWHSIPWILYDLLAIGYRVREGKGKAAMKGRAEALGKLWTMWIKRRRIQRCKRVSFRGLGMKRLETPAKLGARFGFLHTISHVAFPVVSS